MKKYTIAEMQAMDSPPWIRCTSVEQGRKLGKYYWNKEGRDRRNPPPWQNIDFQGYIPFFVYIGNNKVIGGWNDSTKYNKRQMYPEKEIIEFSQVIFPEEQTNTKDMNNEKETFEVDKDFIKEAHKAACTDWKKKLEDKFPEVFIAEPCKLEKRELSTASYSGNFPFFIGGNWAERHLRERCLMIKDDYRMEIKIHPESGRQQLVFYKK